MLSGISSFIDHSSYEVVMAEDGRQALETFTNSNGKFVLIFTDINMPNMNGIELTQEIRSGDLNPDIPIVALTSEEGQEMKNRGKQVGISAWTNKPPTKEAIAKIIDHFIK